VLHKGQSNLAKGNIAFLSYLPDGSTRRKVGPGGCIWDPHLVTRGGLRGSAMVPFKRVMVVFYRP